MTAPVEELQAAGRLVLRRRRTVAAGCLGVPAALVLLAAVRRTLLPEPLVLAAAAALVLAAMTVTVFLVVPLAIGQDRSTGVVDRTLHAVTLRGLRTVDLDRLHRVWGRTLRGRWATTHVLGLHADRWLVVRWGDARTDEVDPALRRAVQRAVARSRDVQVGERARALLRLPHAPDRRRRAVLGLVTVVQVAALLLAAAVVAVLAAAVVVGPLLD